MDRLGDLVVPGAGGCSTDLQQRFGSENAALDAVFLKVDAESSRDYIVQAVHNGSRQAGGPVIGQAPQQEDRDFVDLDGGARPHPLKKGPPSTKSP
ncbi:MAG: hypothetical protein ACI9BK_000805 [Acidimicrobiales bacterium]